MRGCACRCSLRFSLAQAVIVTYALTATAYPDLFVRRQANSCTDHPQRGFGDHEQPVVDKTTTFTLVPVDAATGAPSTSLCPGYIYQVSVNYGGVSRATLLTATLGSFKSSTDNACPNRSIGMTPAPVYSDQLTVPCSAVAGSSLELQVTSAAFASDNYHQASATYPISALEKCPSSTCQSTEAATASDSKAATSSSTDALTATSGVAQPLILVSNAGSGNSSSSKTSTDTAQAAKATTQGRPALGSGVLARLFNTTSTGVRLAAHNTGGNSAGSSSAAGDKGSAESNVTASDGSHLPQAAAAAGSAVKAAMAAAARSAAVPRKAGGDFPVLNQLTSAATQLLNQQQHATTKAAGTANMPLLAGLSQAADKTLNNFKHQSNPTNGAAGASGQDTFPLLRAALGLDNSSAALAFKTSGLPTGAGAANSAATQWQELLAAVLQKIQAAVKGASGTVHHQVQAASGPVSLTNTSDSQASKP